MLCSGLCEFGDGVRITHKFGDDKTIISLNNDFADSQAKVMATLAKVLSLIDAPIDAVGHRVVHGGHQFDKAVKIDDALISAIDDLSALAPLHNPIALIGIRAMMAHLDAPQVAVFDTAYHQTLSPVAYRYPLPSSLGTHIRKYGFHGSSHAHAAHILNQQVQGGGFIIAHLGNGCSVSAVLDGKSVDTTMGFTPLAGLMMGTRTGDIDPALVLYLAKNGVADLDTLLNKQSGLLGVSGLSNDLRVLENSNDDNARLAIEMFADRAAKAMLAMCATLPRLDGIAFTGGVGENSADMRARICQKLWAIGVRLDNDKNAKTVRGTQGSIHADGLWVQVISADEEGQIARETRQCLMS